MSYRHAGYETHGRGKWSAVREVNKLLHVTNRLFHSLVRYWTQSSHSTDRMAEKIFNMVLVMVFDIRERFGIVLLPRSPSQ